MKKKCNAVSAVSATDQGHCTSFMTSSRKSEFKTQNSEFYLTNMKINNHSQ